MANEWDENKSEESNDSAGTGATPAGMVEAVTQNVELIVDKVMDTAEDAVVAVQEKLGMRRPAPRRRRTLPNGPVWTRGSDFVSKPSRISGGAS